MSDLRVASIAGTDGTSPATLVKQSAAKAWANLNGTGTIAIRASFNVSGLLDNGTGDYRVYHTNAFTGVDYSPVSAGSNDGSGGRFVACSIENSTTTRAYGFTPTSGSATDIDFLSIAMFGDLA